MSLSGTTTEHPPGFLRLGTDDESNQPLDLELPTELADNVFLAGASGSGKTTTIRRISDGALANSFGLVIIDCKAGDLGATAELLADKYELPFYVVDPDDPQSLGYNPCSGDAGAVANKLVGAFSFSTEAEIYKNIAMEAIPVIVRGLHAADEPVDLDAIYHACAPRGMVKIAQNIPDDDRYERIRARLYELGSDDNNKLRASGYKGLQRRLGALTEGKFGELFANPAQLDWEPVLAEPSVTYIALSTLASSEDVELMGRVIAQDLKHVCSRRIKARARGDDIIPTLAIFDEFAALREADQLADFLLQARQALMPAVVSTQYLPESTAMRKACLSAGLLIAHRLESVDAEAVAGQFGTRRVSELTNQVDFDTGYASKGSIHKVDKYNVHPNQLRDFDKGQVALRSALTHRRAIVHIYPDTGRPA